VGYVGLNEGTGRLRHTGYLWLAVDPQHHRTGVGTALLRAVIDLADRWLLLERLELTVLATNPGAQRLYERMGFVVEGRKRGSVLSDGAYVDEILMARYRPGGPLNR
jgi:RimJ/RimL family protein N-acetyltransferase